MGNVGKWTQCCLNLEAQYKGNPENIADVLKTLIAANSYPGLKELLSGEQPEGKPLQGDAQADDAPVVPQLDKNARTPLNFDLNSSEAYHLLRIYVEFSKKASPEGYEDFHMFCALWLLSVVVARRVYVWLAQKKSIPTSELHYVQSQQRTQNQSPPKSLSPALKRPNASPSHPARENHP